MRIMQTSWLDRLSRWLAGSDFDLINQQSYVRLSTCFQNIKDKKGIVSDQIEEQLEKLRQEPDWNTVKAVELLLIPILDQYDLDMELHYQMHQARLLFSSHEFDFFGQEYKSLAEDDENVLPRKRALLTKLTASLHKFNEDRQLRSIFANKSRLKIGIFFSLAILISVFLLAIGILHPEGIYQYCSRYCPEFTWLTSITADIPDPTETQQIDKIHLHYAISALMAGYMGACFSMLISLKGRVETITLQELDNMHSLHFILTRIITGIGAALICYYFFRAELLSGSLFPDFRDESEIRLNSKTFFTLIIWCFMAGFSEKLVPSILSKTEAQVDRKK